jgi:hypothetical protein
MGEFYYSSVRQKLSPERLDADIVRLNNVVFGGKFCVRRVEGVPVSRGDNRKAQWAFWLTEPPVGFTDCSFTFALLRDGRLEFKVPRSQWDEHWEDQQKLRRKMVRLYNAVES